VNTSELADQIVNAVLYEGYLLYPYRQSAVKNRVRWTFGGIHPRAYSDEHQGSEPWQMRTQCLLRAEPECRVDVEVRFLQLLERRSADSPLRQEATERRAGETGIDPYALLLGPMTLPITLSASIDEEGGVWREAKPILSSVEISFEEAAAGVLRMTVVISNHTPVRAGLSRDEALMHSLVSANTLLRVTGGSFVSLADPPGDLGDPAAACHNVGTWPVLVGEPGATDTLLSSPITLEDYPRIASESPGDLFDSTEIDEILSLRILAMSDEEKEDVRAGDERGRKVLERTESLTAHDLMQMHGAIRGGLRPVKDEPE
jgi:hydrogenase maturation protease